MCCLARLTFENWAETLLDAKIKSSKAKIILCFIMFLVFLIAPTTRGKTFFFFGKVTFVGKMVNGKLF